MTAFVSAFQVAFSFATLPQASAQDIVHGQLIQFVENGAWSWYQDERVVVDQQRGKLLVSSLANRSGAGGRERDGDVDVTIYDLATGARETETLRHGLISYGGGDDHNLSALLVRPDGKYLAMYAGHNNDKFSYYRIHAGGKWGPEQKFDWNSIPGGSDFQTTYSNLFFLSDTQQTINIARSHKRSPNLMISSDQGDTWKYGGLLTQPEESIGYVNGYFKYTSNGKDRIDFICTEHHPRDYDTSVFHGYMQAGKTYSGDGKLLDEDISDMKAPKAAELLPVIKAGTKSGDVALQHLWVIDLQRYADGTLSAICSARADNKLPDHRFVYARFDGKEWTWSELAKAGGPLFAREQDYTGLGALFPNDANSIVISTPIHPTTGKETSNHELYRGKTADKGKTWTWAAITEDSAVDNLRPVIPAWDESSTAILWWRGTYRTSQDYTASVVGLIERAAKKE